MFTSIMESPPPRSCLPRRHVANLVNHTHRCYCRHRRCVNAHRDDSLRMLHIHRETNCNTTSSFTRVSLNEKSSTTNPNNQYSHGNPSDTLSSCLTKSRPATSLGEEDIELRPANQHRPVSAAIAPLPPPPIPHARPYSPLGDNAPTGAMFSRTSSPRRKIRFQH